MTRHTYPTSAMLGDYARAAAGLAPTLVILATTPVGILAGTVLGGFAVLFAVFGIRTALRHGTRIEITEVALRASGLVRASIPWGELNRMKVAYYCTRRDGRGGWMQLELRSSRSTLRLDSRIQGFVELVETAARAAEIRGLLLSAATCANLQALGVRLHAAETGLGVAARSLA
jgi:hypothetical protein